MVRAVRYRDGVPVYRYQTAPQVPPVSVLRFDDGHQPGHGRRHIHEFPVLLYVERARQPVAGDSSESIQDGDAYVVAADEVINPGIVTTIASGRGLFFDPTALGGDIQAPWSSWRAHPLLLPFLHAVPGGLLRLHVPPARRPIWSATIAAIETELSDRDEGYRQAVLAYLTVLLVDVARLATDVVGDLRRSNETLLAEVFDTIEKRFAEPLSPREVAKSVGMTPGHLTTLVRRRTGGTLGDWITERRMAQARRLLTETDLPVNEIARRVGLPDPGYFARVFRRGNGTTPRAWRLNTQAQPPTLRTTRADFVP
ncbi:MAG TPA: AraC family transcriptional regulator [Actinocrinis sp.]|jgi:AraC-like DNA-binding protein|nr:AraC family transcriptional regulator [Actinocrinis sp.]HEV3173640.1 AraC family transcriptional regulator [Actinocrinis sp.]